MKTTQAIKETKNQLFGQLLFAHNLKQGSIDKKKTRYGPLRFTRIWEKKSCNMHADMSLQYDLIVKYP